MHRSLGKCAQRLTRFVRWRNDKWWGPKFTLIGGCLSHGGLNGTAKIAAEGSPSASPPSFETMPDILWAPGHAFTSLAPTNLQLQPAGANQAGWD
jgi:hypothetical protein